MAAGNIKDLTNCPVCTEPYSTTGENIPKVLPCMHSLCTKCTTKKLWQYQCSFECPQCGKLCVFTGGVELVPDNTYISAHLKTKANYQEETKQQCQEHGRELILYCDSCHTCLCFLCSRNEHQECNIFGLQEEKLSVILFEKIRCLRKTLEDDKKMLLKANSYRDQKAETCIEQINLEKEQKLKEITALFEEIIKSVLQKNVQVNTVIDKSLTEINANIEKIKHLERNRNSMLPMNILFAIKDIQRSPDHSVNYFYEYVKSNVNLQSVCGQLKQRELLLDKDQNIQESNSHVGDQDIQENNSHASYQNTQESSAYVSDQSMQENSSNASDQNIQENSSNVNDEVMHGNSVHASGHYLQENSFQTSDQDTQVSRSHASEQENSSYTSDQGIQENGSHVSDRNRSYVCDQNRQENNSHTSAQGKQENSSYGSDQSMQENSSDVSDHHTICPNVSDQKERIEDRSYADISTEIALLHRVKNDLFDTRMQNWLQDASIPTKKQSKMGDGNRQSDFDQLYHGSNFAKESETESFVVSHPAGNDEPDADLDASCGFSTEPGDDDGNELETEFNAVRGPQPQSTENNESDVGSDAAGGEPGDDDWNDSEIEFNAVRGPQLQATVNNESDAGSDDGNESETDSGPPQLNPVENGQPDAGLDEPGKNNLQPYVYLGERVDKVQVLQQNSLRFKTCKEYDERKVRRILEAVTVGDKLCKVCNKILSGANSLRIHIRSKHMKANKFTCKKCSKKYSRRAAVREHHKRKHQEDAPRFAFEYCEKTYFTASERNWHQKWHTTFIPCKYNCGKTCSYIYNIKVHERICPYQPGGKAAIEKIPCPYCKKTFTHPDIARTHVRQEHGQTCYMYSI